VTGRIHHFYGYHDNLARHANERRGRKAMLIAEDKVVSFHYRLSEPGQEAVDDSRDGQPVVYLHGHDGMLPGLEEALTGKQVGDKFTVTLPPEKAYGPRREDAVQRISVKRVINPGNKRVNYRPGMVVQVNSDHGPREVTVIKAGLKTIDVDTNHPMAGRTLQFEIEVVDVRDATDEEIAHGHVHGVGGHQH
jgi:FKBP-type peptidyl-prolyl cis-trans isomerase SlyD